MKHRTLDFLHMLSALTLAAGVASAHSAAPGSWLGGSDSCATPGAIAGQGTFAFDNSVATTGAQGQSEASCAQSGAAGVERDVWFRWTADATGTAVLDTCNFQTSVDTKIAVYPDAGCPAAGTSLACDDDLCALQSSVAWEVTLGQSYMIQLGSSPGASGGTGTFTIGIGTVGGALATYTAGTAGNPAVAPSPITQGWSEVDSSNGNIVPIDVSPDGATGWNAWRIPDTLSGGGARLHYEVLLGGAGLAVARHAGWELALRKRVVVAPTESLFLEFATGNDAIDQRYRLWFKIDANGTLQARVHGAGAPTYPCPNALDGAYHTFALRKGPGQLAVGAEFLYDGISLGPVPPAVGDVNTVDGGVQWGTGSNANQGTAHWNEVRFTTGVPAAGTPYCFGDGSGTSCPCGNLSSGPSGCANSTGSGAALVAEGSASAGADDLVLAGANLLPNQPALAFAGTNAVNQGDGVLFGDGLRCAGMNLVRLGVKLPDAGGAATWGPGLVSQGGWGAGDVRYFQLWYRDPAGSACGNGFNLSNGLEVTFLP